MELLVSGKNPIEIENVLKELCDISNKAFERASEKHKNVPLFTVTYLKQKDNSFKVVIPFDERIITKNVPAIGGLIVKRWKSDTKKGLEKAFKEKNVKVKVKAL